MTFTLPEPKDDGLIKNEVKPHAQDKHHALKRYMHAFTTAMYRKWYTYYVDLFCESGVDDMQDVGLDWGSPLLAAQMPKRFSRLMLNDLNSDKINALKQRLPRYKQPQEPMILNEDANKAVDKIVDAIPAKSLTLAFIDPYGLDLAFSSIEKLSTRKTDLVIFFPDHVSMIRNWKAYFFGQEQSKLDAFLGTKEWRSRILESNTDSHIDIFRSIYENQLGKLGYEFTSPHRIKSQSNRPIYRLMFASREKLGREIWERVLLKDRGGQSSFDFSGG